MRKKKGNVCSRANVSCENSPIMWPAENKSFLKSEGEGCAEDLT